MPSGDYAALLWRRALAMLEGAEWRLARGEYDLACFEAEQAAQLALKSVIYTLTGSHPRVHSPTELLGVLVRFLENAGLKGPAEALASYASRERRRLWFLEESYYKGRYGITPYERGDAEACIEAARGLIETLKEVVGAAKR